MDHDYIPLSEVAARIGHPVHVLRELARVGRFPEIVRLTERRASVRRDLLDQWLRESTISADSTRRQRAGLASAAAGPAMPRAIRPKRRRHVEAGR